MEGLFISLWSFFCQNFIYLFISYFCSFSYYYLFQSMLVYKHQTFNRAFCLLQAGKFQINSNSKTHKAVPDRGVVGLIHGGDFINKEHK
jgi:hypothetical protein